MSRIGNQILAIPENVIAEVIDSNLIVKGPLGQLELKLNKDITVEINDSKIIVKRGNELVPTKQLHGTTNANIKNMLIGVSKGFSKELEIVGVGYRFNIKGIA
jgi:large subunit ribosomal protein L6